MLAAALVVFNAASFGAPAASTPRAAPPSSKPAPRAAPKSAAPSPRNRPKETLSSFYRGDRSAKSATAASKKSSFAASARPAVTAEYRESVRHWHEASGHEAPRGPNGLPCLVLVNLNSKERAELCPRTATGTFELASLEAAALIFREPGSDNAHAVHPRLLDVLYSIQEHFHSGEVRLLSGYRSPWEGNSNHGKGRAADIVVPGASDEGTAAYARTLGYVGVGIYPTSHFVHVDVRDASYFWVDASAPGRAHRERGILAQVAKESDAKALERGEHRTFGPRIGRDATAWLAARRAIAAPSAAGDEPAIDETPATDDTEGSDDGSD